LKIGKQYDLNLDRNTVGFERKSLGFDWFVYLSRAVKRGLWS